ncbi:hypothetical protein GCM10009624_21700 [Gordonia sinesedis]
MDAKRIEKQLAQMWATRPVRPSSPRTVAGVCAGIADRYRVDPTLVKVAFVVAAIFGGSGVIVYLAAWIALPSHHTVSQRAQTGGWPTAQHYGHGSRRRRHGWSSGWHGNPKLVLLVVVAVIVLTSIGPNRTWGSGALLGGILMMLGWWLLYQRTPTPPPGTSVDTVTAPAPVSAGQFDRWIPRAALAAGYTPGAPMPPTVSAPRAGTTPTLRAVATPTGVDLHKTTVPDARDTDTTSAPGTATTAPAATSADTDSTPYARLLDDADRLPPAWDPLGAARFAWDLPEPSTPAETPEAATRRRRPATLLVLGVAVLVAAAGAAANRLGATWFTPGHVLSLALAVVGVGLVINAGLRRRPGERPGGLVPIAILLGISVIVTTAAVSGSAVRDRFVPAGGMGERNWKPVSENDIRSEYSLGAGSLTLDLRNVTLTRDRRVELRAGAGEILVQLPPTMNVRTECSTGIGDNRCAEGLSGGTDGAEGPVLTINARTGMGQVEVKR